MVAWCVQGLCQEKASLLSEVQALRQAHEHRDVLQQHNLSLQSELLSLRSTLVHREAELRGLRGSPPPPTTTHAEGGSRTASPPAPRATRSPPM